MLTGILISAALLFPAADPKGSGAYPGSEMLIEAEALLRPEVARGLVILDVRSETKYGEGHVPGAIWWDTSAGGESIGAKSLAKAGIGSTSKVVIYDDGGVREAARLWWRLKYSGQEKVSLLNGGTVAWQAAGGKLTTAAAPIKELEAGKLVPSKRLATRADMLELLKNKSAQIVDARSEKEYCGETKHAKRAGAIPGSINLEWSDLIDAKTKKFKPADELTKLFKEAGIDLNKPVVTYCQSGGRASVMAFGLELLGARDVRNYYKSWSEWGNDPDTPIETPKPKRKD